MKVGLRGFKELDAALLGLSVKVAKRVARQAVRKAVKPVLEAARAKVPVDEGRLKRSLRIKVGRGFDAVTGPEETVIEAQVGLGGAVSKKYRRRTTKRKVKDAKGKVRDYNYQIGSRPDVYGKFVEFGTGDTAPQPYLRPAWDKEGGLPAIDRVGKELWAGIEREVAKAR